MSSSPALSLKLILRKDTFTSLNKSPWTYIFSDDGNGSVDIFILFAEDINIPCIFLIIFEKNIIHILTSKLNVLYEQQVKAGK
jgi:hypothetical protein